MILKRAMKYKRDCHPERRPSERSERRQAKDLL